MGVGIILILYRTRLAMMYVQGYDNTVGRIFKKSTAPQTGHWWVVFGILLLFAGLGIITGFPD